MDHQTNKKIYEYNIDTQCDANFTSNDFIPITERWDPLGANDNDEESKQPDIMENQSEYHSFSCDNKGSKDISPLSTSLKNTVNYQIPSGIVVENVRIKSLEDEQEMLTTSLMALTTHFAQVQFRLRQIVEAEPIERDHLLKNLEEFAFRGIPEMTLNEIHNENNENDDKTEYLVKSTRLNQFEVINRLKEQLTDLEKFAYESGSPVLPQAIVLEKQKIIIDELKSKLNLNVNDNDLPNLTTEDLRIQVDTAIGEFIGPLKMKEKLVTQLKTQITDLERFIAFLQCSTDDTQINAINFDQVIQSYSTSTDKAIFQDPLSKSADVKIESETKLMENSAYNSYSAKKKAAARSKLTTNATGVDLVSSSASGELSLNADNHTKQSNKTLNNLVSPKQDVTLHNKAHNVLDKATALLQMFAMSQFGCAIQKFDKNSLKKTQCGNHWGDLRAKLELDVQEVIGLVISINKDQEQIVIMKSLKYLRHQKPTLSTSLLSSQQTLIQHQPQSSTKSFSGETTNANENIPKKLSPYKLSMRNSDLITLIRRNFAFTLQKLIQHGLRSDRSPTNNTIVPFMGCFSSGTHAGNEYLRHNYQTNYNSASDDDDEHDDENSQWSSNDYEQNCKQMHAWELILEYYSINNGESYNDTPARRLSQSFNLDIVGSQAISNKQSLLSAVGTIITMHSPYKRSFNSHFKAFVCAALNSHKLVQWLNLLFQCSNLITNYYEPWAYVARTGFRDALRTIDCLTKYDFDLPIDLAIRQFENIKDVFL